MPDAASPSDDVWLGLDLGTQSVRCLAVSGMGEQLSGASRRLTSRREGPRHEQEPEDWWEALVAACRAALAEVVPDSIRGLACCSTSGTILLVDENGAPLTPGLMYDDTRAAEEARRANEAGEAVWRSLGYRIQPSWALPKLLWLLREEDGRSGARLAHQADFINRRLVAREVAADMSHALTSGSDVVKERWPHDVLSELGVPEQSLPDVVRPGTELGEVGAEAADATGIPEGTPVVAGMTDGCAAQIGAGGAGALSVGSWNSVLGTTLVLEGVSDELVRDPAGAVYSHRSPDGGWLPGGASSVGAGALSVHYAGRDLEAGEHSRQLATRGTGLGGQHGAHHAERVVEDGLVEREALGLAVLGDQREPATDTLARAAHGDGLVVQRHRAAVERMHPERRLEQLGAARALQTGEADDLAGADGEVDAVDVRVAGALQRQPDLTDLGPAAGPLLTWRPSLRMVIVEQRSKISLSRWET